MVDRASSGKRSLRVRIVVRSTIKYYKNMKIHHYTSCSYPLIGTKFFRLKLPRSCYYAAVKRITDTLRHFYPSVTVMAAVPYLFQRDELRNMGGAQVVALAPEGTLSFGRSILGELGTKPDNIETIIDSLRADDYAAIRDVGGTFTTTPSQGVAEAGARQAKVHKGRR